MTIDLSKQVELENPDVFVDEANHSYVTMPMYSLIEYSDNYSNTSGSLQQFKRDEVPNNNTDLTTHNSQSFKYEAVLVGKTADPVNNTSSSVINTKIVVPLKYLSNLWRSLEMPLTNCRVHLKLIQIEQCILSSAGDSAKFKIKDAKLHVPIVNISTKNNVNRTKQLSDGFKRFVYWNNYQTIPSKVINDDINIYGLLSASFQGVKRLFIPPYDNTDDNEAGIKDNKKYFFPGAKFENYNVLIDGRKFYDQPTNDLIKRDKVMIILHVVYQIMHILKIIID